MSIYQQAETRWISDTGLDRAKPKKTLNERMILMKFAVLDDYVLSFYQWINVEYGIVKRQFKELCDSDKDRLKREYKEYKKEE